MVFVGNTKKMNIGWKWVNLSLLVMQKENEVCIKFLLQSDCWKQ